MRAVRGDGQASPTRGSCGLKRCLQVLQVEYFERAGESIHVGRGGDEVGLGL